MVILSLFWSNERFYRITWVGRETLKPVLSNSPTVNRDIHSLISDSVVPVAKLWKKFNVSGESAVKAGWFYRCHSRYWGSHGGLLSCSFIQPISQVAMEKSEKCEAFLHVSQFMLPMWFQQQEKTTAGGIKTAGRRPEQVIWLNDICLETALHSAVITQMAQLALLLLEQRALIFTTSDV